MKKRAAIYTRVSSRDQIDGLSLDDQLHTCRKLAEQQGMQVVGVYQEPGRSAYKGKRPAFDRMLADAQQGKIDVVLLYKYDRFSRNTLSQLKLAAELEQTGVEFYSVTEPTDRRTASGRLTFTMMAAVAQFTSDTTGERVASARREAFHQGLWVGPVPIGYTRNKETRMLEPNDDAAAVVLAYDLYASGTHSFASVADALNARGYRIPNVQTHTRNLFSAYSVREILRNSVYIGNVKLKGQKQPGKHAPLVAQETWEQVRARFTRRVGNGRASLRSHGQRSDCVGLLTTIGVCVECGGRMWLQNGVNRARPYYICSNRQRRTCEAPMVRVDYIDEQIYQFFECLAIPEAWYHQIIAVVQEKLHPQAEPPAIDRDALKRKLERLALTFANEDIDKTTYERERKKVLAMLAETSEEPQKQTLDISQIMCMLKEMPRRLREGDQALQRNIVREVLDSVWIESHRIVAIRPTKVYVPMVEAVKGLKREPGGDRTHDLRIKSPLLYR